MQQVFDRWSELIGITYVFEPNDDGASFPQADGQLGVRADVRIGGHVIDGPFNVLAYNFFPTAGDMIIDTQDTFYNNTGNNSLRFRNTFSHEHGHGIGLSHTCPGNGTKVMEPNISLNFDGPQHDDILSAQRFYGDRFGANNSIATATDLGTFSDGVQSVTNLSLVTNSDIDYYRFNTAAGSRRATVTLTPVGFTYLEAEQNQDGSCPAGTSFNSLILRNLAIEIIDSNGSTVLATASSQASGVEELLSNIDLGGGTGPFYLRVFGDTTDQVQLYDLTINIVDGTPQPEMAVFGNGVEIADGDTTPSTPDGTDIGSQLLGQAVTNFFLITNSGTLTLNLTTPVLTGAGTTDFSINPLASSALAPNEGTTMEVVFSPIAVGARNVTISIGNDDFTENPYDFAIQGVGLAIPEIAVLGNGAVITDGSTTVSAGNGTDFGVVDALAGTSTRTYVITNTGLTNLTLTLPVTLSGPNAADFAITTQPGLTSIPAGGSTSFTVVFDPGTVGIKDATVNFANNDADESPYDFAIRGTGSLVAEIAVGGGGQSIADGDVTPSVADNTDFGGAEILSGSTVRTFTITNLGSAPLTISSPVITGAAQGDFQVTVFPATSLLPGSTTSFGVTFDPITVGVRNATVSISNNDSDENPFDFAIAGLGTTAPDIGVLGNALPIVDGDTTPETLDNTDFGGIPAGSGVVDRSFVITNEGSAELAVALPIVITGVAAGDYQVLADPDTTVAVGGSTSFSIRFTPSVAGVRDAAVTIVSDDANENPYNYSITGRGTVARIGAFGNGIVINNGDNTPQVADGTEFGTLDVTSGALAHTFVFTNTGDATLSLLLPLTITGANATDFRVTRSPSSSLAPGASTDFDVQFNPNGTGLRSAVLNMANSDSTANPFTFTVQGAGTGPDIEVLGNGFLVLDGSTNTTITNLTDFGTNTVATGSTNTFVITNAGTGQLRLNLPITLTSNLFGDFFISRQPPTNALLAGEFTTFDVVFGPVGGGDRTAVVNVASSDSDEDPFDFLVRGLGDGPEITLLGNDLVITNGDPTPDVLDGTVFGGADLNSGFVDRTFTITNEGTQPLTIRLPINAVGDAAADFSVLASVIPVNSGLIAYYPFSGDADNAVADNLHGQVLGPQPVADRFGNPSSAYRFDGFDDFIRIPNDPAFGAPAFSMSLWFRAADLPSSMVPTNAARMLFAKGQNNLEIHTGSELTGDRGMKFLPRFVSLGTVTDWHTPTNSFQTNQWTHVVGVYDPGNSDIRFYIDGQRVPLQGPAATPQAPDRPFEARIGRRVDGTFPFNGDIDEVRLYNRALTGAEVVQLQTNSVLVVPPGGFREFQVRFDPTAAGSRTAQINVSSDDSDESMFSFAVQGNGIVIPPTITSHPVGRNLNALQDATLLVGANGTAPLSYFWFKNGVQIPGADGAALALNDVTLADAGLYHVVVSNLAGVVTSSPAQVTVNLLPSVVSWSDPAAIVYGTPLSAAQLNASANAAGTFAYSPSPGAVLAAGNHTLNVTFTPANSQVYAGSMASVSILVNQAMLTLRADDQQRLVNTANPSLTFTALGYVNGDNDTSLSPQPSLGTTATMGSSAGTYPITISGAGNANYMINFVAGTLRVFEAAPGIVRQPADITTNALSDVVFSVAATGVDPLQYQWFKDSIPLVGQTGSALSLSSVTVNDAGAYTVQILNGSGSVLSDPAQLAVNKLNPVITWADPVDIRYGTALSGTQLNAGADVGGSFDYTPAAGIVLDAGTNTLNVTFTPTDALNYNAVGGAATLVVTNAPLIIAAENKAREFGLANPVFTFSYVGFVNGDTDASLVTPALATTIADASSLPGNYAIVAGGATSPNYLIAHTNGVLTVFANPPVITDQPDALTVVRSNSAMFSVVAGGTAPLSYQWRHAGTPIAGATMASFTIPMTTVDDAGVYDVVVSNVGGSATSGSASLNVLVPPTIVQPPAGQNGTAAGSVTFSVVAQGTIPLFYQWQKDGTDIPNQTNALLPLVNLTTNDVGDYRVVITNDAGSVTSSIAPLMITRLTPLVTWATPGDISYGTALGQAQLNASANIPGTFTYTPALGDVSPGGAQVLSVLFTPLDTGRYEPVNVNRNINVSPVPLIVTADNASREVGTVNPAFTVSYSGFVNSDGPGDLAVQPMVNTGADQASPVGTYPLIPGGGVSANYTFSYVNGTLTVVAVPVSITQQPTSLIVTQGMDATFTVAAAGSPPINHQWRRNGTNLVGEVAASLNITGVVAADDASYDVIVSNGANAVTSAVVTLDVLLPSTITWPMPANIVYGAGLSANELNAVADVAGTLTYTPDLGTVLAAGVQALSVAFAPTDTNTHLPTNAIVNLTIDPAPLTVAADGKFREFGTANPPLTASFSGFVNGEDFNALTTQPILATTADLNTLPGNVPITISGATAPNYAINHVAGTLTVFANLPNITSAPGSLTVTNGDPVTLTATAAGTAPLSLQWRFNGTPIPDETNSTFIIAAAQTSNAGTYDIVVTNVAGMITSQLAALTVLVPPAITVQPQSQTFNAFSDVTFTVTATGTADLQYQWFHNGQPLANETNNVLSLISVSPNEVGTYVVTVSNAAGTVTSAAATLSVNELAPDITWATPTDITYGTALSIAQLNAGTFVPGTFVYNPPAGTVLDRGTHTLNVAFNPTDSTNFLSTNASVMITVGPATLSVIAEDKSREFNTANPALTVGYNGFVNGDDNTVLTAQPMLSTTADINSLPGDYPINISGAAAANYAISHVAGTLNVFANAPNITQQPTNTATTNGLDTTLAVVAAGTAPISYQWRKDGVDLTNETNAAFNITGAVSGTHDGAYDVVLANIAGSVTSQVANLTVLIAPNIVTQPVDATADALSSTNFTVAATGTGPLRYQWRKDGVDLPAGTNSILSLNQVSPSDAGAYSVVVANDAGSVTSAAASLTVNLLTPTITWSDPASMVYGMALDANQLNATANTSGTFVYTPAAGAILSAGSHPLMVDFTPDDQVNYIATSASVSVQVVPAPLSIRADDKTREFGAANPSLTETYLGFVNNETEAVLTSQPVLSTTADQSSGLGGYPIAISGAAAANYSITHVPGTLTVFGIPPTVTRHPVGVTVAVGADVSFTNAATGTAPLTYQWRKAGISLPGETNTVLSLTNVVAFDSGAYDVVASNVAGSAASFAAVLNVLVPPIFVLNPSNTLVAIDQPIQLRSLAAGSAPMNYQWFKDGVLLSGETNSDLTYAAANLAAIGDYWVVANNVAGVSTSAVVQLAVTQLPSLVQQPASMDMVQGSPLTLSAQAYGQPPLTYQWLRNGVVLTNSTSSAYSIAALGPGDVGVYKVIVSNGFGQSQSQTFLVTLTGPPVLMQQPTNAVVLPGTNVVLEVIASGSQPLTYRWQKDGQVVPGASGRVLTLTNVTAADAGFYNVAVGNLISVAASDFAEVTVITPPVITLQPTNQIGAQGAALTMGVTVLSPVPPTYQWRFQGVPAAGGTNSTFSIASLLPANSGVYDVIISNPAGAVTSQVANVNVLLPPTLLQQPAGQTVAVGQSAAFAALSAGTGPLGFQWMKEGVDIPGATGSTLVLNGVSRADQAAYSVRVVNAVGSVNSTTAPLRVVAPQALQPVSGGRLERFRFHFGDQSGGLLTPADAAGFVVEASADLRNWTIVSSNGVGLTLTNGQFRFEDINSVILPFRYYRVREQ